MLNYARASSIPSLLNLQLEAGVEDDRGEKGGGGGGAVALKMLIIQMRQSVPAWCQCHHSSNYYHGNAIATVNRSVIYLVKAIRGFD